MKAKKTLKEKAVEGIYHDIEEGFYKANAIIMIDTFHCFFL